MPFAPLRGLIEAQAIVKGKIQLARTLRRQLAWTIRGHNEDPGVPPFSRIHKLQHHSPLRTTRKSVGLLRCKLAIISRSGIQQFSFIDVWILRDLQWDCEAEESLEIGKKAKDFFQSKNAVFLERGLFRLAFGRASCRFAEAPGAQLKENEKMRSSWINNILPPEALSAQF